MELAAPDVGSKETRHRQDRATQELNLAARANRTRRRDLVVTVLLCGQRLGWSKDVARIIARMVVPVHEGRLLAVVQDQQQTKALMELTPHSQRSLSVSYSLRAVGIAFCARDDEAWIFGEGGRALIWSFARHSWKRVATPAFPSVGTHFIFTCIKGHLSLIVLSGARDEVYHVGRDRKLRHVPSALPPRTVQGKRFAGTTGVMCGSILIVMSNSSSCKAVDFSANKKCCVRMSWIDLESRQPRWHEMPSVVEGFHFRELPTLAVRGSFLFLCGGSDHSAWDPYNRTLRSMDLSEAPLTWLPRAEEEALNTAAAWWNGLYKVLFTYPALNWGTGRSLPGQHGDTLQYFLGL